MFCGCAWLYVVSLKVYFSGRLCIFSSMVRHRGLRSPIICRSHICGIGLYAILRAYIWWSLQENQPNVTGCD